MFMKCLFQFLYRSIYDKKSELLTHTHTHTHTHTYIYIYIYNENIALKEFLIKYFQCIMRENAEQYQYSSVKMYIRCKTAHLMIVIVKLKVVNFIVLHFIYFLNLNNIYIYIPTYFRGVMVILVANGDGDSSSLPGRGCSHVRYR